MSIRFAWWRSFWPARTAITTHERLRLVAGALIGIFLTGLLCHLIDGSIRQQLPWLVAPLGASAVLVFALPASPLAQPWAVVGGNTVSALVRVAGMQRHLADLLPLFTSTGHHHIPVIGDGERLVGIITQSDMVAALGRAADPAV